MKKLLLLLQLMLCCIFCKAQAPNWLWAEPAYGSGYGYCSGLALGPNDTLYMVGREGGTLTLGGITISPGGTYPFFGKLDTNYLASPNNAVWVNTGLNSGFDYAYGICSDKENNLYNTGDENSGGSAYVIKFNPLGTQVALNNTGVGNGQGTGVVVDNSENVYETGNYDGSPTFGTTTLPYGGAAWAGFLTKFDSTLNPIWATYFDATDGSNNNYVTGKSVALDLQGNVYVVGSYQGSAIFYSANGGPSIAAPVMPPGTGGISTGNLFVAKYDSSGTALWVINAPNAGMENNSWGYVNKIKVDSCGNVYVAGYFQNTATFGTISVTCTGTNDMFVAKFNTKSMVWEWVETGLGNGSTYATDIALDKTSDVYVVGGFSAPATFSDTVLSSGTNFIAKYANSNGALQWIQSANLAGQSAGVSGVVVDGQNYAYIDGTYSGASSTLGSVTLPSADGGSDFIAKLDTVPPRVITPFLDSAYCPGSTFNLNYNVIGTFNGSNTFTAQLSDSTGSFLNSTNIGSVNSDTSGTIGVTIPANTPQGSSYLIRVVSSNPPASSYVNGCGAYYAKGVYINDFYITIGNILGGLSVTPADTNICSGASVTLTASGGTSYLWTGTTDTTNTDVVTPTSDTTIYYVAISNGTCKGTDSVTVVTNAVTPLLIQPQSQSVCVGEAITLRVSAADTSYIWSPSSTLNSSMGDTVVATPTITTVYSVTGTSAGGCTSTGTDTVSIVPAPPFYIQPPSQSICGNTSIVLSVTASGTDYVWSPASSVSPSTGNIVTATPTIATIYTVTGIDSLGCIVTASDTISISPTPGKPTITQSGNELISSATEGNQWVRNDTVLTGATNQTYIAIIQGYYQVITENPANGCNSISDSAFTGINQLSAISNQLSIYPNPTGGEIYVNVNSSAEDIKDWTLQITDVLGRRIYSMSSLNYKNAIDLSRLASGVYFITVINNTARAVFPVVKQN